MLELIQTLLLLAAGAALGFLLAERRRSSNDSSMADERSAPLGAVHLVFVDVPERDSVDVLAAMEGGETATITGLHALRPDGSAYSVLEQSLLPVQVGPTLSELGSVWVQRAREGPRNLRGLRLEFEDRVPEITSPETLERFFACGHASTGADAGPPPLLPKPVREPR